LARLQFIVQLPKSMIFSNPEVYNDRGSLRGSSIQGGIEKWGIGDSARQPKLHPAGVNATRSRQQLSNTQKLQHLNDIGASSTLPTEPAC
jgi:hypothetical protein